MSFFPNKFLLNLLACGLILSCPMNLVTAANGETKTNGKEATKKEPVQKKESKLTWQNYAFPESGFSIDLPKKPEQTHQVIDIPKSELKIHYDTYLSEPSDTLVYVVSVWHYPVEIDMSKPDVNLKDGFGGMLQALPGSKVLDMQISDQDHFKTLEFLVENEDIYFQGKLMIVYNTLYQVFTVYKNSEEMKNNYAHFINSFKLIEPEKRKLPPPAEKKETEAKESKKMNV